MEQLLLELLIRLETVGERDESLFDTVVREKMGDQIFYGFIKPQPGYVLPDEYGMPDEENRLIKLRLKLSSRERSPSFQHWASTRSINGSPRSRTWPLDRAEERL